MRILSFSYLLDIGTIVQAFQKITELKKRFYKKGAPKNFAKFTGKSLCQSLTCVLKKGLWDRCFPVYFAKYARTPFLTEQFR